eukprot:3290494-Prymnesium_polylepis.2
MQPRVGEAHSRARPRRWRAELASAPQMRLDLQSRANSAIRLGPSPCPEVGLLKSEDPGDYRPYRPPTTLALARIGLGPPRPTWAHLGQQLGRRSGTVGAH